MLIACAWVVQATEDLEAIRGRVHGLLATAGLPASYVPDDELLRFCKNANNLVVMRPRSLAEEVSPDTADKDAILTDIACADVSSVQRRRDAAACCVLCTVTRVWAFVTQAPENAAVVWHLALRAVDRFHAEVGRYPGSTDETVRGCDSLPVVGTPRHCCVAAAGLAGGVRRRPTGCHRRIAVRELGS
jgi:amyloid beta precursor protein binding protein 1